MGVPGEYDEKVGIHGEMDINYDVMCIVILISSSL
jgi:hypothetical protein